MTLADQKKDDIYCNSECEEEPTQAVKDTFVQTRKIQVRTKLDFGILESPKSPLKKSKRRSPLDNKLVSMFLLTCHSFHLVAVSPPLVPVNPR